LTTKTKPTAALVIPDVHVRKKPGGHDRRSLDAVLKYASDQKWSHVVYVGDVMDHNSISSHNLGNLRSVSGETLMDDYEVANELLDDFALATPHAKKIFIEGNHEYRAERLVNAQPQLQGMVEAQYALNLAGRDTTWVPYWSKGTIFSLGKASFGHGRYTGEHHAAKHAHKYGRNFYYGHLHDMQSHTVERDGDDLKYEAASLGCLCEYQQSYLQGRPTRWQQGFGVCRFQPNGSFNMFAVRIFNHSFISPEGKLYKG
jgi:Calcineurin-like phosphoesterase